MAATQEKATHPDPPSCDVVGAKGAVQEWVPVADERRAAAPLVEAVGKLIAPAEDVRDPPAKPSSKGHFVCGYYYPLFDLSFGGLTAAIPIVMRAQTSHPLDPLSAAEILVAVATVRAAGATPEVL
ncbi:hypothetical protein BHE74_00055654 [Ensete ventricosum]|nr:hypothetical protein BHE74_00055654 [Ensete ventricosum]RZR80427.1 hypothetical protein BHM03_00006463 [Ensete ventricosum]